MRVASCKLLDCGVASRLHTPLYSGSKCGMQYTASHPVYWMFLAIIRRQPTRSKSMGQLAKRLKNSKSCVRRSYRLRMKKTGEMVNILFGYRDLRKQYTNSLSRSSALLDRRDRWSSTLRPRLSEASGLPGSSLQVEVNTGAKRCHQKLEYKPTNRHVKRKEKNYFVSDCKSY